ncbi:M23 family metallopeptidase [Flavobacterium sp.]|uniref:M23 family metallopeptidase n=1 Tax=Flavobacterium sp. TaxID=239 RepID=UPI0037517A75
MRLLILTLMTSFFCNSQEKYPQDYFRSPLDIPIQLSGNFGELRPNHFHAGFDIKTQQKEGLNIYAVADGYVSRIKISIYGYGKAIYITHPNGYTSVYGHLQKASGTIQDKIIELQYDQKSYEIEAFFKPNEILVTKGQVIAISGNTGGSEGPHLHFEFRENKTENALNPLLFGLSVKDTKKPVVSSLMVYPIDNESVVNSSKRPISLNLSLQADGTYVSEKVLASGKIGFGIISSDFDDVSFNNNGTYKIQISDNGKTIFSYEFDKIAFEEARFINAFIDYDRYKKMRNRVQKLFMKNEYKLANIKSNINNGILNIVPNYMDTEKIEVSDFYGNTTKITIPVSYSAGLNVVPVEPKTTKYFIKAKSDTNFEKDNFSVFFPANTFYDDFYMNFDVKNKTLFLHEDVVPAHTNFTISVEDSVSSASEKSRMFIAAVNGIKLGYNATNLVGNTFTCKARTLGQFKLVKDTVAPKISIAKPIQDKWITGQKSISITISDDLSGVKTYNGYINDKWVLFEYENKLKRLTHTFADKLLLEGKNNLKIVVTDNVGNSTIFETQFNRSQKK